MTTKDTQSKMQTAKRIKGALYDSFVDYKTFVYKRIEDPEGKLKQGFHIYNVNSSWYVAFYTSNNRLPSDEAFGNTAYCCRTLEEAWKYIGVLENKLALGAIKYKNF